MEVEKAEPLTWVYLFINSSFRIITANNKNMDTDVETVHIVQNTTPKKITSGL